MVLSMTVVATAGVAETEILATSGLCASASTSRFFTVLWLETTPMT